MPNPIFNRMPRLFMNRFREKELAQYSENGAASRPVQVIFNEAYAPVSTDGVAFDDVAPTCWVAVADCPSVSNRDSFVINGTTYRADSCKPDGYGMTAIKLKK